jgi:hypothetical protein
MASSNLTPSEAERIAEITADAADQFLISYIVLTRFAECGPYSIGFAMAHCLELSIKAVYWQEKKQAPPRNQGAGHHLYPLIEALKPGIGDELEALLPPPETRTKFDASVDTMNEANIRDMLAKFFEINPNFDDDTWMLLYALYRLMHVKFGVDTKQRILQLMQPTNPKLNKKVLRLIGCARKGFPNSDNHQREIRRFVERIETATPQRPSIIDRLRELVETGKTADYPGDNADAQPVSLLTFEPEELALLKDTLSL